MKPVTIFVLEACPYCREALTWMDELKKDNPEYKDIEIIKIDEWREPEIANSYDYYYVPTCYVDGVKVHEGAATKNIVKKILDAAKE
jgi:thioredoxin 1